MVTWCDSETFDILLILLFDSELKNMAGMNLLILGTHILLVCVTADYRHARKGFRMTPLDDYVASPDPSFNWTEFENKTFNERSTIHYLNVTSQEWKNDEWSDTSLWWHYVAVAIPDVITFTDTALIFLHNGDNVLDDLPTPDNVPLTGLLASLAEDTGAICVNFRNIPNQPITFVTDPDQRARREDDMIAFTWRTFVDDPTDPEILARLPMTKAAVRGMDTVTEFAAQEAPGTNITKFVVAGISKRGWTTWTTAAVDNRVIAQAPIVLTSLPFIPSVYKHYQSMGGWSFALVDYYRENLTLELENPNTQLAMDIVDPYSYIDRYMMPTMVISASEDEFFLPDDSWLFYDDIPSTQKCMMVLDDTEHSLFPFTHVWDYFRSFFIAVINDYPLPETSWAMTQTNTTGRTTFTSNVPPLNILAYWADNNTPDRRDFRALQGANPTPSNISWFTEPVQDLGNNVYSVEFDNPASGWKAFFIEATFEGAQGSDITVTSEVNIIPHLFPYPKCEGDECYGVLL